MKKKRCKKKLPRWLEFLNSTEYIPWPTRAWVENWPRIRFKIVLVLVCKPDRVLDLESWYLVECKCGHASKNKTCRWKKNRKRKQIRNHGKLYHCRKITKEKLKQKCYTTHMCFREKKHIFSHSFFTGDHRLRRARSSGRSRLVPSCVV